MNYRRLALLPPILLALFASFVNAQDRWTQVRSKNFLLIGNDSEKDIKKAGTKLEQFREAFRLLFPNTNLTSSVPPNVVVFKNDSAYKPFKPKRADGKIDEWIAGYFQPGEDVNYITLAAGGDESSTFGTIFHEYVHFIIDANFGKTEVPQWFNEGLAEYYQTFEIVDDIKVKLGLAQAGHLELLKQTKLMPLEQMLKVSNYQLHQSGGHSRSIFYAQSWALVHYLTQGGKTAALNTYLKAVLNGTDEKEAFERAFQTTYAKMEADLRKYVSKSSYQYYEASFKQKLDFTSSMQASPLPESEANAYLGDLLYHNNRADDAEPYLRNALRLDPNSNLANTALGMVKLKQRKFGDARGFLEKAIAGDQRNHAAYYQYALLLSREGQDEFGFASKFDPGSAAKMRDALNKAIAINPAFAESYELFAFVALVTGEEFETAEKHLLTAIRLHPGNQRYSVRLAEVYARQKKFDDALQLAQKIAANAATDEYRSRANSLLTQIQQQKQFEAQLKTEKERYEKSLAESGGTPRLVKRIEGVPRPSEEEIAKLEEDERIRSMNESLRLPAPGEKRALGHIEKIDCKKRPITFGIRTDDESFSLTGKDFTSLSLVSIDPAATNAELGCDANVSRFRALISYKELVPPKLGVRGEIVAIEFVPSNFRVMTGKEMRDATLVVWDMEGSKPNGTQIPSDDQIEARRREAIIKGIRENLRKPADGEKRDIGYLEKVECNDKAAFFHFRTPSRTFRLFSPASKQPNIVLYTPDLAGAQFGCGMKPLEFPAVFVYTVSADAKAKTDGSLVSIEIVPKSFVLEQ